jgi:hypothetical protein
MVVVAVVVTAILLPEMSRRQTGGNEAANSVTRDVEGSSVKTPPFEVPHKSEVEQSPSRQIESDRNNNLNPNVVRTTDSSKLDSATQPQALGSESPATRSK